MNNFNNTYYYQFLSQIPPFNTEMNLLGIEALLHQLGDFHLTLKVIHIAGTNGKGSSIKMLSSIYKASGYKVGSYTSPYIYDYRECIHINDIIIDASLMNIATKKVESAYQELENLNLPLPTHYECITVVALMALYLEKVDIALIEVLMGGLNDATNIFKTPLASLITSISYDHIEYLGSTIESIATHKAGIIKENCLVVINHNNESVCDVVKSYALTKNAPLYLSDDIANSAYSASDFNSFSNSLTLKGNHQIDNLKGVITVISKLNYIFPINSRQILLGLSKVSHPCRLELIQKNAYNYLLDGSHNEEGILALTNYLKKEYPSQHLIFILGILKDKNLSMIKQHIYEIADEVILTEPLNPRKYNINEFYIMLNEQEKSKTTLEPELIKSLKLTNKKQATNTLIIACGSLYVSYPIRQLLLEG